MLEGSMYMFIIKQEKYKTGYLNINYDKKYNMS